MSFKSTNRFLALFGFAAAMVVAPIDSASAQGILQPSPIIDKTVKEIEVQYTGSASVDEQRIRANMVTRVGDPYTAETTSQIISRLYSSGLVRNVRVTPRAVSGGVKLVLNVEAQGPIGAIQFAGAQSIEPATLRRVSGLNVGDVVNPGVLLEARNAIADKYRRKGYPDARVSYQTAGDLEGGFTRVVFSVNEGEQAFLRDIVIEGNEAFDDRELKKVMETKEKTFYRLLSGTAGKLDAGRVQGDRLGLERFYKNQGYQQARVENLWRERATDKKVDLHVKIFEGPVYRVNDIAISGVTIFPVANLTPLLSATSGANYSLEATEEDAKLIRDYYGSKGYADASVRTRLLSAGDQVYDLVYEVNEGSKSYINKVNIGGNVVTKDHVIRRELPFTPGEEYNTVKVEAGKRRLNNMGYFGAVDLLPTSSGIDGYKDLNISLAEKRTGSLNFGAGVSSIDNVVGFFSLTQTNFDILDWPSLTGGGQKFRLDLKYGSERRDFQMSVVEPWFLGQKLSLGVDLFYRDLLFFSDEYDQRNYGASVFLKKPLGKHTHVRGEYRIQKVEILDIEDSASDQIRAEEGDFLESQINLNVVRDTRDSVFLPRSGHKLEFGTMVTGEFLGGDVDVYGFSAGAVQHVNLPGDIIFSLEGKANVVDSFDSGANVPIFERLFLGGARSMRGFDYRDVSPKDGNGEPLGGRTSAFASAEVTFPIIEKVRGAMFYDLGFVNEDEFDWDSGNLNSNWGFGLRLYLPVGPIQLDYGIPIDADEFNDSSGRFNFYLGYEF